MDLAANEWKSAEGKSYGADALARLGMFEPGIQEWYRGLMFVQVKCAKYVPVQTGVGLQCSLRSDSSYRSSFITHISKC